MKIGMYSLTSRLQTNAPTALSSKLTPNVHIVIASIRVIRLYTKPLNWLANLLQVNKSVTSEKVNEIKAKIIEQGVNEMWVN